MKSRLTGLATAVFDHVVTREQARQFAHGQFGRAIPGVDRLLRIFDHPALSQRNLAMPVAWFAREHGFAERNRVYCQRALELMERACRDAIANAGVEREELGALVVVSSTGLATPSLDASLVQRLDLPRHIQRLPLWGLGCAGGGSALARSQVLARGLGKPVIACAVELCSLTFVPEDQSSANLVATSLFGDGATAFIVEPDRATIPNCEPDHTGDPGLELLGSFGRVFDDTEELMGWDLADDGLRVRFAKTIPSFVSQRSRDFVDDACEACGVRREQLEHFVVHPGGPRVLEAYDSSLGLARKQLESAWHVLDRHGNMSSPTILFVLERFLADTPATGGLGIALAVGPGFAAEATLFRH